MKSALVWLFRFAGFGVAAVLVGGYLGTVHPLGDSLSVVRLWAAGSLVAIALAALALRDRRVSFGLAILALVAAGPIGMGMWRDPPAPDQVDVVVYAKNLGSASADVASLMADVDVIEPDVLLLQEVTRIGASQLLAHLTAHPYWHFCESPRWTGIAIAARWPLSDTACSAHRSLATARVEAPGGRIHVASVHQVWPFPYQQGELLPMVLDMVVADEDRRIIAGDFNMVPWGHSVRRIADVSETRRVGRIQTTIRVRNVPLPIDHVLTNGAGEVSRRPQFGSDHYGLVARIGFAAGE